MTDPFHRGEIAIQERTGERNQAILNGRMIWSAIPAAARLFVSQQSHVAIGWVDATGDPWASLVVSRPGFASCDDSGTVLTIFSSDRFQNHETLHDAIRSPGALGLLFIDLATRRRLRVNGVVERSDARELRIAVEQAYPNCPKYIQRRERVDAAPGDSPSTISQGRGTPPDLETWLSRTDTAFLASVGPDGSVDCSHRGGRRGYMHLRGDTVLVPDYPGNSMFCSLGNMAVEPRAGLVLVDFDAGLQLHLSGDAFVEVNLTDRKELTGGSGRWWTLRPRRWAISSLGQAAYWRMIDDSPFNPPVVP